MAKKQCIYFLSDVHLKFTDSSEEKEKKEKLLEFLEMVESRGTELYILGDLFDFWFEWYHVIPRYWSDILFKIREVVRAGVAVHMLPGNHDFYSEKYLQDDIGMQFHPDHLTLTRSRKRFFVAHGDGYAPRDRGYRLLKKILRNRLSIFLFKTFISPDLGMVMARWISGSSRKYRRIDRSYLHSEYRKCARRKFAEGMDYVILGHIHAPVMEKVNGKIYVNCGDWMKHFSYVVFEDRKLELKYWGANAT